MMESVVRTSVSAKGAGADNEVRTTTPWGKPPS